MSLKSNIQSNKAAILYYTGVFLVSAFNVTVQQMGDVIPQDIWWGQVIQGIANLGLIYFTIIAKFVFGRDADLDRVKTERKDLGVLLEASNIKNEGYRITNMLQADILNENQFKPYRYSELKEKEMKEKIETIDLEK